MTPGTLLARWVPATAASIFLGALASQLLTGAASTALLTVIPQRYSYSLLVVLSALGWALCGALVGAAQMWAAKHPFPLRSEWIAVTMFAFVSGNFLAGVWPRFSSEVGVAVAWGLMIGVSQASLLMQPQRMILWAVATLAGFAVDVATSAAGMELRKRLLADGHGEFFQLAVYGPVLVTVLAVGLITGGCALLVRDDFAARAGTSLRRRVIVIFALAAVALVLFSIVQKLLQRNALH